MAFTFSKEERLCSNIFIAQLFEKGNPKVNGFPFRFSWVVQPLPVKVPVQVLFLVAKKKIPKANQRNKIKRQMRELYRLNKHPLYKALQNTNRQLILSISFLGNSPMPMDQLAPVFVQTLNKMLYELAKDR